MQLTSDVSEKVVSRGVGKVHEFVIKANAKAFDTLIAGLYSNKIKAVIRELSTNAYEAHQMLKIEHKPFNVKLPSDSDLIVFEEKRSFQLYPFKLNKKEAASPKKNLTKRPEWSTILCYE